MHQEPQNKPIDTFTLVLSSIGIVTFLVIGVSLPLRGKGIFSSLFPKNSSLAFAGQIGLPATQTTTLGQPLVVPITLNTNTGSVSAVDVHITYDRSHLRLTSVTPKAAGTTLKTFLPADTSFAFSEQRAVNQAELSGTLAIGALTFDPATQQALTGFTGSLTATNPLAELTFTPLLPGNTNITIVYSAGNKNDSNMIGGNPPTDQLNAVANSIVTVVPGVSITPTHTADFNLDGAVNIFDVGLFASFYDKVIDGTSSEVMRRCDLNHDSSIDVFDLGALASQYGT